MNKFLLLNIISVILSGSFTIYAYRLYRLMGGKTINYLLIAGCYGVFLRILIVLTGFNIISEIPVPELMIIFWLFLLFGMIGLYRNVRRYINNSHK